MDAARLNSLIYKGRGKAARHIGLDFDVYRPIDMSQPVDVMLFTIKAAFNAADNTYTKPNKYGAPIWYGDFDAREVEVGDYLIGCDSTYFVAGKQSLLPIICIECNRSITLAQTANTTQPETFGALPYSGICSDTVTPVLGSPNGTGLSKYDDRLPCSILFGGREQSDTVVPTSLKQAAWLILLPPSVTIIINSGDMLTDDLGRKYVVLGSEQTDLGWRIKTYESHV